MSKTDVHRVPQGPSRAKHAHRQDTVFYARQGVFRERDLESLVNKASCLSLIINAIVVWNTRYMMAALDHLRSTGYPILEQDLSYLTPLIWEHINMHGTYHFDLVDASRRQGLRPLRAMR